MLAMLWCMLQECLFFLGYVTGKSEFPPALTRPEEEKLVVEMEAGDVRARETLITHNLRLVSHIARKYQVPGYGQDDLISIGVIGLIKAVNSFKSTAGTSLGTYAARCIENAIPSLPRHTGCGGIAFQGKSAKGNGGRKINFAFTLHHGARHGQNLSISLYCYCPGRR